MDQIFTFLPEGISYGLGIPVDQVVMDTIRPLDTVHNLSYTSTLARAYIPQSLVTNLDQAIKDGGSSLYMNPLSSVRSLMSFINPSIPIQVSSSFEALETPPFDRNGEEAGIGFAVTYNALSLLSSSTTYTRLSVGDGSESPVTSVEDYVWHYNLGKSLGPFQPDFPGPGEHCFFTIVFESAYSTVAIGYFNNTSFGSNVSHVRLMDNTTALLYLLANGSVSVVLGDADGNSTSSFPFSTPGPIPFLRFDASACGLNGTSLCIYYQENGTTLAELLYNRTQRAWASPFNISI